MPDNCSHRRKSYRELMQFGSILDKYRYLRIGGAVGRNTFGSCRYLNQVLYSSTEWRRFRDEVITRDNGCDLAQPGYEIKYDRIIIHHLNPLTVQQVLDRDQALFDLDNVVCVSFRTHQAIHYGDETLLPQDPVQRRPNDTCPWK